MVADGWATNLVVGSGGNALLDFTYQPVKLGSRVSDCSCRSPILDWLDCAAGRQGSYSYVDSRRIRVLASFPAKVQVPAPEAEFLPLLV